jgi:histidinol dehydrogenase
MRIINSSELSSDFYSFKNIEEIPLIKEILCNIQNSGNSAVNIYSKKYDNVELDNFKVTKNEIEEAFKNTNEKIISALNIAATNIRTFAEKQLKNFSDFEIEINSGVFTGQKIIPIERAGVYVPGGRFPLVSTLLMCAIPAQVAGVKEIAIFSPPTHHGAIHPAILAAAKIISVDEIYMIGGVQAVGAMAYGTETIKRVDKIVGPGNKYVTLAKKEVFGIVGIDFIAGPTEILIIADETANPDFLAADILAQAEHDVDAQPILVTTSEFLAQKVNERLNVRLEDLSTKEIARKSIDKNGLIVLVSNLEEAVNISNKKAPEHLEVQIKNPESIVNDLKNYGTLFIGEYSAEALGDYSSGLNHTLPTNSTARYTGGLSVKDFIKIQTTLRVTKEGINKIGPAAKIIGETEGLDGHAKSVKARLD